MKIKMKGSNLDFMGCYDLLESIIYDAFNCALVVDKQKAVKEWADSDFGKQCFAIYSDLSGYDKEKMRNSLLKLCTGVQK